MMKYKKIDAGLFMALFVIVIFGFTGPGDDLLTKLMDHLEKWRAEHPKEKVYLHLDKTYYAIGDDVWFKAYVNICRKKSLAVLRGNLKV